MSRVKFTGPLVDGFICPQGKTQAFFWDTEAPGLGVRVTATGAKAYVFQSRLSNKTIRITIGDPKTWFLDAPARAKGDSGKPAITARSEANRLQHIINSGRDPREVEADELAAEQAARDIKQSEAEAIQIQVRRETVTLAMAWPVYIAARRIAKRKGNKQGWSIWHIRDHECVVLRGGLPKKRGKGLTEPGLLASLLDVRLSDLTGLRIAAWLASETEARPTQAALAFRLLSVFANWCESHEEYAGLVPAGACKAQQVRDEMPSSKTKDGDSLQREQLASWFDAVRKMGNPVQSAYLQGLLITGARRRELASLRWSDVDFQWKSITIRDKVEGERIIPLTPYLAHLLAPLPRRKDNPWVFSSPTSKDGQLAEPTPGHKRALIAAGLPDMTLHGLRRSFGSLAEWTETPAGVVAQIMGHKPSAIAEKHYRRRPLDLLRMWHVKIEAWILEQAGIDFLPVEPGLRAIN